MTLRARLLYAGGALLLPVAFLPILERPLFVFALAAVFAVVAAAFDSAAWPVGLAGIGVLIVGLVGSNPFPDKSIAVFTFGWIALAVVFAVLRDEEAVPMRLLLAPPVLLTVLLAVWQLVRLGASEAPAYGEYKLQLFLAQNLAFVVAGILISRRGRDLRLYTVLTLLMATASGIMLATGLSSGQAEAVVGGRFSSSSGQSPIELGRQAALGLLVGAFVLLAYRSVLMRIAAFATLPLIAVAFIASGSRGPVLGLVGGLLVLLLLTLQDPDSRLRVGLVALGGVAAAFVVGRLVPPENVERALSVITGTEGGVSSNGRFELWSEAWSAFVQHPLGGIGTGSFAGTNPGELYPHNLLLEVAAELGLVGLLLVAGTLLYGVVALVQAWRGGEEARPAVALVSALLVSMLLNSLVSSNLPTNNGLWLAVGLAAGLAPAGVRISRAAA
jgi:O-antigen ligase